MKLVGSPLHTFATVLLAMLLSAGLGSLVSGLMGMKTSNHWIWPFVGIVVTGFGFLAVYDEIFGVFLASPLPIRALVVIVMIFPVGFFLGMPFPLGILAIERLPAGAIAWAWALNGLFTVVGGVASVLFGIFFGFKLSLTIALAVYGFAFLSFIPIRSLAGHGTSAR